MGQNPGTFIKKEIVHMVSVRNVTALVLCQLIVFWGYVAAVNYGSDTVVSVVTPLNITGPDNKINTFACLKNGFGFADAATTCSFASAFPVSGPVYLRGGTLYLQSDLILTNTGSLADLGRIKGQQHAVDLPESVSGFASGTQASGAIVLNLLARITASRTIYSADWSYDGKYVAYGISSGSGSDLYVYEFTGTSLVFRASVNIASNGFSVRWSPNSYVIAVGAGSTVRTYKFTPPSTLSYADSESPGGNYYAVSWQGRGRYLAAGGYNTTNSYIRIYSVDSNGAMSLVTTNTNNTTTQFNGSITYDVLKWAPVGNKDDIIAGSSGGSLHLYNFTGTALNHLKNYRQGTNITSLDWASTSTYLALGFSNGNVKTYQHTVATNSIASKTTYTGIDTRARSVSWRNTALELLVGFNYSAAQSEFQVLDFNTSSYALRRAYSIDLTNNVSCVRYSPNGLYILRADDTTRYLSVYKTSYSPFVFEDVKLYLTGNITVGSPLTFKGDCILNARSNLITVTGDGAINVAKDSTLDVEQAYLNFTAPNAFALEGGTSNVKFRNTWLELGSDVLWGDGKFDSYEDLTITGPYVFDYESAYTSTIHSNSTVTFQKGATFKIGKTTQEAPDPLLFEDSASQLSFDNATFHVTGSGLKVTKGTVNIYNESTFDIDHTDTNLSATMQGLWVGDSVRGSEYDAGLVIHGNGSSLSVKNGAIILDSVSPYMNQFLGQSHIIIKNNCTVYVKRPADMSNGWLSADETTSLVFDPNSYLLCNNTYFTNLLYNLRYEDYYLTGTLQAMDGIDLSENSLLNLNTGLLLQVINVIGGNNTIAGVGRFQGLLNFVDSNSSLIWDLTQSLELYDHVYLNGGRIQFTQDSALLNSLTFKTTGTVDITSKSLYLGNQYSEWDGNIYWMGSGGCVLLQEDISLSGVWTFSGDVIVNGYQKTLLFEEGGKIVLERGAHVTFKDLLIENLSDDNPILCSDDTSNITFDYTDIALSGDYTFDKGSFTIYNDTWISSLGTSDVMYTFSYESTKTSTIDEMAFLKIGPRARFSIGREDSSVIDPEQQPLVFVDASSPLILDSGNLHITSSGMIFTKGVLRIQGDSHLEIENQKYDFGLILGDGVNVGNDYQLEITSGARVGIETGKLVYNNYADDEINFGSLESALNIVAWQGLVPQRSMHLMNGTVTTPNAGDVFIVESSGSYVIGDNLHRYDYGRVIDYYVTGTLFVYDGIREIILDSGDQLVTNPGTFAVNLLIIGDSNKVSGLGNVTGALNFADYKSTLTWDMNQKYSGGDIILNGGRIIYTQDSGLDDGYSFIGTGTVDLTTKTFELGTDAATWHGDLYWISSGATLRLNNNVTLDGTWTFSGNVVIEGNNYLIDLAPSGTIVLERGAQVSLKNISIYNVSDQNPIICLDDNCQITMSIADILMSGDYEFDKGSLYIYWNSTIGKLGDLDTVYTFAYTSKATSLIDSFCALKIWPRTVFSIGRQDSTITDPDLQPLTFVDATSQLILDGSTLHITSSGAKFTKGVLQVDGHSILEVENYKDEYGFILGDGTAENDFGCYLSGDGGLTFGYGKVIYNSSQPNDRFVFQNPNAVFELGSGASLKIISDLTIEHGYVLTNPGASVELAPGTTFMESDMTEYSVYPYNSFKVTGKANGLLGYVLDDGGYFYALEGMHIGGIQCNSGNTRIGGVAGISDEYFGPITLAGSGSTVELSMVAPLKSDIVLNGGTIVVESATIFAADKNVTGSGTVQVSGRQITFGTEETYVTNTIHWLAPAQGKLDLRAKTMLTGTWIIDGKIEINGNGNILDLSRGGSLIIRPNSTLLLDDVEVKGLGENFGSIIWDSGTSVLKFSQSYVELDNNFATTRGGIYVGGPTVVGLKNYNWTVDNTASMTVDGVTLWKDSLGSDVCGNFVFGAGDQSKYLSLVSSGTIKTAANEDVIQTIIGGESSGLTTIDHGPANIHFATDSAYTLSYNLNLSTGHFLHMGGNVTVDGNGHTINLAKSSENQVIVDNNASVMLTNVKIENFSENSFNIGSNSQLIFGDGTLVELDPPEQLSETWTFSGESWLLGVGNELELCSGGNIVVAPNSHLTMYDLRVTGLCANNIRCQSDSAVLGLRKADLVLSSNYSFTSGSILFAEDVTISGSNIFTYASGLSSTIDSHAVLYIDQGTTFSYSPRRACRDLLHFDDDSSTLYLDGCSLHSTRTGLTLSGGAVVIDNKVTLSSSAVYDVEGITFDATSMINVLGSATLDVYGRIRYV